MFPPSLPGLTVRGVHQEDSLHAGVPHVQPAAHSVQVVRSLEVDGTDLAVIGDGVPVRVWIFGHGHLRLKPLTLGRTSLQREHNQDYITKDLARLDDRVVHSMSRTVPTVPFRTWKPTIFMISIKKQRRASKKDPFFLRSKAPSRRLWMPELVLHGIRLLA